MKPDDVQKAASLLHRRGGLKSALEKLKGLPALDKVQVSGWHWPADNEFWSYSPLQPDIGLTTSPIFLSRLIDLELFSVETELKLLCVEFE